MEKELLRILQLCRECLNTYRELCQHTNGHLIFGNLKSWCK